MRDDHTELIRTQQTPRLPTCIDPRFMGHERHDGMTCKSRFIRKLIERSFVMLRPF